VHVTGVLRLQSLQFNRETDVLGVGVHLQLLVLTLVADDTDVLLVDGDLVGELLALLQGLVDADLRVDYNLLLDAHCRLDLAARARQVVVVLGQFG